MNRRNRVVTNFSTVQRKQTFSMPILRPDARKILRELEEKYAAQQQAKKGPIDKQRM